jgi:SAM-dependent methyltransferase
MGVDGCSRRDPRGKEQDVISKQTVEGTAAPRARAARPRIKLTGERLHEGSNLFSADFARHRAAYYYALEQAGACERILDLGSGSGYGTAELAERLPSVIGLDRVAPDAASRRATAHFVRADLRALPLRPQAFPRIVSFQVIEHLRDPSPYLSAIARLLRSDGLAIITTPNLETSDRANPYHVHEYEGEELRQTLLRYFEDVQMLGIGATPAARQYHDARVARVQKIMKIDPLNLRSLLPERVIELLFAVFARIVRMGMRRSGELPAIDWRDFPVVDSHRGSIDLLALCRRPKAGA